MNNFRKVYPPSGRLLYDGGKNNKYEPSIIEDNESPDCLNVVFNAGSVGTRNGFKKINTASVGTYVCDGLYSRHGNNNTDTMVAFFNGTGFTLDGTSLVTIPSAQSVFTAGVRVNSAQMENHIFFGNGTAVPYKYNGTNFTRHGVPAPSETASYVTGAAGNPSGVYQYKFTFVNSAVVEGNPSSASANITVSSTKVEITSIPVAPQSHGVGSRKIYRTVTSGTTFLLLTTLSDNTTTTYSDNTADADLGAEAPTDNGEPPNYAAIIYHQNRLFMIDGTNRQLIYYTDLNEPYTVGALNFLTIGDGSTDLAYALGIQDNNLVIFGEQSPWVVYMPDTTPSNWKIIKANSPYSTKSPYGIFNFRNKIGFPAMENDKFVGIGALNNGTQEPTNTFLTMLAVSGNLKTDRVEPDMFDMQEAYVGNISSTVFKNMAYVTMTRTSPNTTNNYVYVLDFSDTIKSNNQSEAWVPWTGLNAAQFCVHNQELYYGSSDAVGFIYKEDEGVYADEGVAINSYFWTKEYFGYKGDESYSKDFRYANLLVDLAGGYFMDFAIRLDSDMGSGTNYQIDLDPGASLWGTMIWGVDTWGGGSNQKDMKMYIADSRGKRIQFKFSNQNTVNQRFKVHWLNFTYNLKGIR